MMFQVAGDYHLGIDINKLDYSKSIVPKEKYLLTVGDIGQVYHDTVWDMYEYFATGWEKTFIIMGNSEYEMFWNGLSFTMETYENLMRQMVAAINKKVGSEKLILIQNGFYDFPEGIRIAGLTLWSTGADRRRIYKESDEPNDSTMRVVEDRILYTNPPQITYELNSKWNTNLTITTTVGKRIPITLEDLQKQQKKEDDFINVMIEECKALKYKLLFVSHYVPTKRLETTGIFKKEFFQGDLYDFLARDKEEVFVEPLIAWVCGHVHGTQKVLVNNIPIYVNWDTIRI